MSAPDTLSTRGPGLATSASSPEEEKRTRRGVGADWSGRSRGGYFGNWFFVQLIRFLGVRWAYGWLVFVAAYFTLAAPAAYRCSVNYLERVLGRQPFWKRPALVYRHFFSFGIALLDRLAVIMGRSSIQCRFDGEALFRGYLEQGKGIILLGAHLGSWEIGAHLLGRLGKPVNIVLLQREEARVRELFDGAMQARQFRLLTTDDDPLRSIPILAALRRGEIVALHGDRAVGSADQPVAFLDGTARLPVGPYLLAALSGAPIFQVFVVREGLGRYRFHTFPARLVPRELLRQPGEALRPYLAEYAQRLASTARQYPFQWYNFYPYWTDSSSATEPKARPDS